MHAFLFDFDGVIVDSERHWMRADTEFFPHIVPGYDADDARNMMGLGLESGWRYLTKRHGAFLPYEEYIQHVEKAVGDIYSHKAKLLPGLLSLLDRLDAMDIPFGIASSSKRTWVETALRRLGILHRFLSIRTGDDVGEKTKPHPDIYRLLLQDLKADPQDCVALEDSDNGIRAAKSANIPCIAIRTDMNETQSLAEANRIISHLDELTEELLLQL